MVQDVQFDFFNYAGLHRPVKLYTTPSAVYIQDITVTTNIETNGSASVDYIVNVSTTSTGSLKPDIKLMARMGGVVASGHSSYPDYMEKGYGASQTMLVKGTILVDNPQLWWPWTMSDNPAYLYVLQVRNASRLRPSNLSVCRLQFVCDSAASTGLGTRLVRRYLRVLPGFIPRD